VERLVVARISQENIQKLHLFCPSAEELSLLELDSTLEII
jgi:hypothetical protein